MNDLDDVYVLGSWANHVPVEPHRSKVGRHDVCGGIVTVVLLQTSKLPTVGVVKMQKMKSH
jgi:hypothetical protein